MLIPSVMFLAFSMWTLFHWQELPDLLKNESAGEKWPLSIHHTATPARLISVTILHSFFALLLFYVTTKIISLFWLSDATPWVTLLLLVVLHFTPITRQLSSYVRYYFQRHLFFPALPSHQEDAIIKTLMAQAEDGITTVKEIEHLHNTLKQQFKGYLHAINLRTLRDEKTLVRREFKQMNYQGLLDSEELTELEVQQLRFHLYSCYRLLTRLILSKYWSGRERRRAFRNIGYTINAHDGSFYSQFRRMKYSITHHVLTRGKH